MGKKSNKKAKAKFRLTFASEDGSFDGKEIDLHKVSQINLSDDKEFIFIEKLKSGDWIMAYTADTMGDVNMLKNIGISKRSDKD